ncbi:prolyl oligopeptidase family serine peptidase [Microbispora amethystogenes]|uniref:S9 family peptidase n=1 Tax=Microbispora amethystogenes TaxID=1427754 RepID=UPI0033F85747
MTAPVITGTAGEETAHRSSETRRINFRFSRRGRYAACLSARGRGPLVPELWDLGGGTPVPMTLGRPAGESSWSTVVPTDGGRILLGRAQAGGVHRLLLITPGEAPAPMPATFHGGGFRLVAGGPEGAAALAFHGAGEGRTTVWRVPAEPGPLEAVATVPAVLGGGVWLDASGRRLALSRHGDEPGTVVLNLPDGSLSPLPGLADGEHLLLAAPRNGVLLTTLRHEGTYRLGVRGTDDDGPTVFPRPLNEIDGAVTPLAFDPEGRRLALLVTRGVRSHLLVYDLTTEEIREAGLPAGALYPSAHWSTAGLHVIHTTPDRPYAPLTVLNASGAPATRRGGDRATARAHSYDGPGGRIEAVVYGDPARSRQVVLALHGGPEAAWQLSFDPLFRQMSARGIAVVAPNQRGSTGYGAAHRDAIRGAWGGPDLADILHLGRVVGAGRGPGACRPMLYGASYGAYLALLAVAADPHLWSRAAVVAPFLSGRELYTDGPATVRAMLDRLGGLEEITDDELGPRDLLRLAGRLRLPLLVVHGEHDDVIPVSHSRRLRDRLAEVAPPGAELTYLEVTGAGHDPLTGRGAHLVRDRLVHFLDTGSAQLS